MLWWKPTLVHDTFWRAVLQRSGAAWTSTTSSRPPSASVLITAPTRGWLPMRRNPSAFLIGFGLAVLPHFARAQAVVPVNLVDQAQKQVVAYVAKLADLHCTEDVVQEKLKPNGGTEL